MKLYNADCMQIMRNLPDKSVDLTLTDIPYGEVDRPSNGLRKLDKGKADITTFDLRKFCDEILRITKGSIYIFCGIGQISTIQQKFMQDKLSTRLCIWEKINPNQMNGEHIWLSGIEPCIYGKRGGGTFNEKCKNTVWRYPLGSSSLHPTMKNLDLIEYLVKVSSNKGDTIFDPCMGSGTTGVAALELNRDFIGIELDKGYFDIASERISKIPDQTTLF